MWGAHIAAYTVETNKKESKLLLDSLDSFLSNWLVFSIPACKVLNKVFIHQPFSNSGVHPHRGPNVLPRQAYNSGKQAMSPANRYTSTISIDNHSFIVTKESGEGVHKIFSFLW